MMLSPEREAALKSICGNDLVLREKYLQAYAKYDAAHRPIISGHFNLTLTYSFKCACWRAVLVGSVNEPVTPSQAVWFLLYGGEIP